jgi:hypothetical protein
VGVQLRNKEMKPIYIVLKDSLVEYSGQDRTRAVEVAREMSGLDAGISLGNVEIWESIERSNKIVWSCEWEPPSGPLEPQIFVGTPSLAPQYECNRRN